MIEDVLITKEELELVPGYKNLEDNVNALLSQQKKTWDLCNEGYKSLQTVKIKNFGFDGFSIKVQFNHGRIISSSAKVDEKSINSRECFLCYNHLPEKQKGLLFQKRFLILCNPYPIFNKHFTIASTEHLPQLIEDTFDIPLDLSIELGENFTVFYNGPKCGASAPDHLHFQAGDKFFMPIDSEYEKIKTVLGEKIVENKELKIYAVDNYLRKFFSFESGDREILNRTFEKFYSIFEKVSVQGEEPMMNILFSYKNEKWIVIIFPRSKHRPSQYFEEGENNILISPAGVDLGGVLITPLEKDFNKLTKDIIINIYRQVTITTEYFEFIKKSLILE